MALRRAARALHAGAGVDLRAVPLGRLRQAVREAAHVHLAAALVQQPAESDRCDLGPHARASRISTSVSTPSRTSRSALRASASSCAGRVASLSLPVRTKSQSIASSRTMRSTASTASS
jgi:hypothetical protein